MSIFVAPLIVLLFALAVTGRMAWLRQQGRPVSSSLQRGRDAIWIGVAFSAVLACVQAGIIH